MRIWSLHPSHLDRMGLLACWRETLLAQAVLAERTKGYRNHPQLQRFRSHEDPLTAVGAYLGVIAEEAGDRGYRFDFSRILRPVAPRALVGADTGAAPARIAVTEGQLAYEWQHLGLKLRERSPEDAESRMRGGPLPHPLFSVVPGDIEPWERPQPTPRSGKPGSPAPEARNGS